MTRPLSWVFCLCLLTLPAIYAVFTGGADSPYAFAVTVFDLGLAGIAGGLLLFRAAPASRAERLINTAALLFIAYVAFQLIPLPIALLRVISPTRAEIADALSGLTGGGHWAPLSVAPPTTWVQLSRISAYAVAFFLARQLVRRSPFGPWTATLPLIMIGAAQAGWALVTSDGATSLISGSYPNRNHFAGLLEMTLPFALMYGLSVLHRSGRRGVLAMSHVAQAALPLAATCLMLVAILFSSSKSGAIACGLALFFMTALSLGRGLPRGKRWGFLALLMLLMLVAFVFLTPSDLVERFGSMASDQPTEGRLPIWLDTLHLIAAFPLFGCGLGAFFPAFLRYQIAGVGWAWTNTHNDYLQLLSELGIVGFVAPALLMASVFQRAVGAASDQDVRESRFVGLACTGSLIAILTHSVTDFNTYVTANGLVLAWVAGIAATLGPSAAEPHPGHATIGYGLGPIVLLLGVGTAAYGGAWLMFLNGHQGDVEAERRFCRFGVCDTVGTLLALQSRAAEANPAKPTLAPDVLMSYLDRDRAAPYSWEALGDAFIKAGRRDEARDALARAVALGPTSGPTLLLAADFQFDEGDEKAGFNLTSRALQVGGDAQLYNDAFTMLAAKKIAPTRVADALAMDRPTTLALLRRLLQPDFLDLDAARSVWAWALGRGFVDEVVAREYTNALLHHKRSREAWDDWVRYAARGNAEGYPATNRIFNGGFERESAGGVFDWRIDPRAGVKATFDGDQPREGKRSLRLTFDGTENVGDVGVLQQVYLAPGHYVFRAHVRSQNLKTDQGVAFRISFDPSPIELDVTTEPVRGTVDWTSEAAEFDAPKEGGVVSVRIMRKPSLKFDKLVSGQLWIDAVTIEPESP